ncbi:MAG: MBL fold metallo-hydrolase [Comamonadaceae bacterium]|nr:MBL fold metallo-hydrolase [Comamonadaceae bacterium]
MQGTGGMATRANAAFNSNAAFVVTDDGVVVFDALGTTALGAQLRQAIARVTPQPVRRVIVSHYHADHFYGLQAFEGAGVEIWAHSRARATLESDLHSQPAGAAPPRPRARTSMSAHDSSPPRAGSTSSKARNSPSPSGGVRFRLIDVAGAHSRRGPDAVRRGRSAPAGRRPVLQRAPAVRRQCRLQGLAGGDGSHRAAGAEGGDPGPRCGLAAIRSPTSR